MMCSCGDGDPPRVLAQRYRKARKPRACSECSRITPRGRWYVEINGLWGDSWDYFTQCLNCCARYDAWQKVECSAVMAQLHETIVECLVTHERYPRVGDGVTRIRRTIDRETGRKYLAAKRVAWARINTEVNQLADAQRLRYFIAAKSREAAKRLRAVPDRVT
jgi:hypothetical protein